MNDVLLEVQSLRCERDERLLFENLSFVVGKGEIVQLTGPNGAGKTTLLRGIAGLSTRCEGTVLWKGEQRSDTPHRFWSDILYLGHEPGVKLAMSPLENLAWNTSLWPEPRPTESQMQAALGCLGLDRCERTLCQYLSAGQRRRVALARLALSPASLWILDEPFTAIDADGIAVIERLIAEHTAAGGALLLATHQRLTNDQNVAQVVIGDGR